MPAYVSGHARGSTAPAVSIHIPLHKAAADCKAALQGGLAVDLRLQRSQRSSTAAPTVSPPSGESAG